MSVSENDNQPVQQSSGSENPTKPVGMLTYFWWTILTLISVTVVLLILATINQNPQPEEERRAEEERKARIEQGKECPQSEEELRARAEKRKGPILRSVLRPELFEKTGKTIDEQIDLVFEPIYERIPEFLDWHYSVPGQYQQLGAAAFGYLKNEMEERLFLGVNEQLESATVNFDKIFETEFHSLLSQKIQDEVQTVDKECETTYEHMLTKVMQNSVRRFTSSVPASGLASFKSAISGKALFGAITKAMSKKLFASVVIKTSGKLAAKAAGAGGTAAVGAATGSLLGPGGAVVGGVVGGIVGWLAVDTVVVTIDEHFNRDEFEQEFRALIDKKKAEMKSDMESFIPKTLERVTPSEF